MNGRMVTLRFNVIFLNSNTIFSMFIMESQGQAAGMLLFHSWNADFSILTQQIPDIPPVGCPYCFVLPPKKGKNKSGLMQLQGKALWWRFVTHERVLGNVKPARAKSRIWAPERRNCNKTNFRTTILRGIFSKFPAFKCLSQIWILSN